MGKNKKDSLGDRMKEYENVSKSRLMKRTPVILRLDGRAFHTFTRGFHKPFDELLAKTMQDTMLSLCENIQGCVLGYTQSDEITLVLVDYKNKNAEPWFDNEVQKMCSLASSIATLSFERAFRGRGFVYPYFTEEDRKYRDVYGKALRRGAMFDCRAFNLPKDEVCNCLIWRQQDAIRNSIQMVGHANFSQKEMHGKNTKIIRDELLSKKGINWDDFDDMYKRGSCCVKSKVTLENGVERMKWAIDINIPIFTENRNYIEKLITFDNEI